MGERNNNIPPPIREDMNTTYIVEKLTTTYANRYEKLVKDEIIENLKRATPWFNKDRTFSENYFNKLRNEHPKLYASIFSFPNYFHIRDDGYIRDEKGFVLGVAGASINIYKYSQQSIIHKDSITYDFFFALIFSWLNKTKAIDFLKFHYRCNFDSKKREFTIFLNKLSYGYNYFLSKNWLLNINALDNLDTKLSEILDKSKERDKGIDNNTTISFKEIFTTKDWKKYIDALHKIENPVINGNYEFIGKTQKHKGVICSWIKDLQTKGIIDKKYNRKQLAAVLNNEIKGLNLGKDGKTIDNMSLTYENDYKNGLFKLTDLLP